MTPASKIPDPVVARRRFLAVCGKFALATPPAVSLMLAASERNYAVAASGVAGGGGDQTSGIGDPYRDYGNINFTAQNNCNSLNINSIANRSNCKL